MSRPSAPLDQRHPLLTGIFGYLTLGLALTLLGNLGLRQLGHGLPGGSWLRGALAIATVVPLGMAALHFQRKVTKELDELLQRVLLEGFATGMAGFILLAGLGMNLQAAGVLAWRPDAPELLVAPVLCIGAGIASRWRAYQ